MKNNKGFTLIELLAIVVILAVIAALAAPSMTREIKRSEDENENILNQKIENAAHIYAAKYYADKIVNDIGFKITLNDLVEDGLVNFKNDICKDQLDKEIIINGSNYIYSNIKDNNCYICNKADNSKGNICN